MKSLTALLIIALLVTGWLTFQPATYAQDTSPVETPAPDVPDVPPDPVPIPPTLLELIVKLLTEGAGWLTGIVLLGIGIGQKWLVSLVRRLFPNDDKTATKINGGVAEIVAGLTSIVTALIDFGLAYATEFVSSADLVSLLALAGVTFLSGWSVHKVGKVSKIARVLNLVAELKK